MLAALGFTALNGVALAANFPVTTTADSGAGSLRQAILDANSTPGADTISFAIPGAGLQTIAPASLLPVITETVTIDGYSQPGASPNTLVVGNNAVLRIQIDGINSLTQGLRLQGLSSGGSVIRGLV